MASAPVAGAGVPVSLSLSSSIPPLRCSAEWTLTGIHGIEKDLAVAVAKAEIPIVGRSILFNTCQLEDDMLGRNNGSQQEPARARKSHWSGSIGHHRGHLDISAEQELLAGK
jgi:hypothetical protein